MEKTQMRKFLKDESGVTAIEYGVIAAAMGVALVVVMPSLAGKITTQFSNIGSHIASGK
jgi:pilus assembly protein Flp/PilA